MPVGVMLPRMDEPVGKMAAVELVHYGSHLDDLGTGAEDDVGEGHGGSLGEELDIVAHNVIILHEYRMFKRIIHSKMLF